MLNARLLRAREIVGSPRSHFSNAAENAEKPIRVAVLAEPFPRTVDQGVVLVFAIQFSELEMGELAMPTQIWALGSRGVRFQVAAIFAAVEIGFGRPSTNIPDLSWLGSRLSTALSVRVTMNPFGKFTVLVATFWCPTD